MLKGCPTETSTQINSTRQRRCYLNMKTRDTGKSKGLEWKSNLKLNVLALAQKMAPHYHRTNQGIFFLSFFVQRCRVKAVTLSIVFFFVFLCFPLSTLLLLTGMKRGVDSAGRLCSGAESLFFFFLVFVTVVLIMAEACKIDDGVFFVF